MEKRTKRILVISLILIVLFFLASVFVNYIVKQKIEDKIEASSRLIDLTYRNLNVSALQSKVSFTDLKLVLKGKTTEATNLEVALDEFLINDISYWDILFNEKITIGDIQLLKPKIKYYHNSSANFETFKSSNKKQITKEILIDNLTIKEGSVSFFNFENDSIIFKTNQLNVDAKKLVFNQEKVASKLPFTYGSFNLEMKNLFYALDDFENLKVETLAISDKETSLKKLSLKTKYSKARLSQIIASERDHFDLKIDSITVKNQTFGYANDSVFQFKSQLATLYKPEVSIYRDKLVSDDETKKRMYSKMLRDLNFDLALDKVEIKSGYISYAERVNDSPKPGELQFSDLNATIKNLCNIYGKSINTAIKINSIFMKATPLNVDWQFDVGNLNDHFTFKADIGDLPANNLNQFMKPNLKVAFEGDLKKTYFTIDGNNTKSLVDLSVKYDDFKVVILNEEGNEEKGLLTGIVNLFLSKDSKDASQDFRKSSKKEVERNPTKSIFNFIWLNTKAGLLSAIAGDGEKD